MPLAQVKEKVQRALLVIVMEFVWLHLDVRERLSRMFVMDPQTSNAVLVRQQFKQFIG
jgi:hypothetical protein